MIGTQYQQTLQYMRDGEVGNMMKNENLSTKEAEVILYNKVLAMCAFGREGALECENCQMGARFKMEEIGRKLCDLFHEEYLEEYEGWKRGQVKFPEAIDFLLGDQDKDDGSWARGPEGTIDNRLRQRLTPASSFQSRNGEGTLGYPVTRSRCTRRSVGRRRKSNS